MLVDYTFYTASGGTSIPVDEWGAYSLRAEHQLNYYKRIYTVTAPDCNAEKKAICAMADAMAFFCEAQNGEAVSSASVGSVSISYAGGRGVDISAEAQEKELLRCARTYLDIYRGVG